MMKMVDTWMVLIFPFLDFIPFGLPRYWLFRDKLRISFRYTVVLMTVIAAANSAAFYCINLGGYEAAAQWTTLMRYSFMLVNLAFSFLLIKDSFPKLMFTYLLQVAWAFFVYGNANFIESRYFWDFSDLHPYLIYNIARVLIYLITCPLMLNFFFHTVKSALNIEDDFMWRHLWKIPLFSAMFGLLYCFSDDVYAYATWQFMISRYLMLFGACYVSYVALKVLEISRNKTQLETALDYADRNLQTQKKQYESLAVHMDEIRQARHDLRQHLTVVQSYVEQDDKAGLKEYISLYKSQLPPDTLELYCRDDVVNAIICCYAAQAHDSKIRFDAMVDYPDNCSISATDITVLLGNLLENALEACKREKADQKFIKLRIKQRDSLAILILIDNTCVKPAVFQGETPLSSKRKGNGIGIFSIREIAARYDGSTQFKQEDGVFYTSVYLKNQAAGSYENLSAIPTVNPAASVTYGTAE